LRSVLLEEEDQYAHHDAEQSHTFYKCSRQDHVRADVTGSFGLASDGFQCGRTDQTHADTRTDGSQTGAETGTHLRHTVDGQEENAKKVEHKNWLWIKKEMPWWMTWLVLFYGMTGAVRSYTGSDFFVLVMRINDCFGNEQRTEVYKDVSLQYGHEKFKTVNERGEQHREN
jgi:hypothetical protein